MKKIIFWILVLLFITGTIINTIATKEYEQVVVAKEGTHLSIEKIWFDEDDINISISVPRRVLDLEDTRNSPDDGLLIYEITKGDQRDRITITKDMYYAHSSDLQSFKADRKSFIKSHRGCNSFELKLIEVSNEIENAEMEFRIYAEVPGILISPKGIIHKIIWYFNFWIVWGIGLVILGVNIYRK